MQLIALRPGNGQVHPSVCVCDNPERPAPAPGFAFLHLCIHMHYIFLWQCEESIFAVLDVLDESQQHQTQEMVLQDTAAEPRLVPVCVCVCVFSVCVCVFLHFLGFRVWDVGCRAGNVFSPDRMCSVLSGRMCCWC